jgi:5-formyltetrahydrofolate cyclo-ligase
MARHMQPDDDMASRAKADLRGRLRQRRDDHVASLSVEARSLAFRTPASPVQRLIRAAACVGAYQGRGSEAPTGGMLDLAARVGVITALPAFAQRHAPMAFHHWAPGELLEAGPWRVAQPVQCGEPVIPSLLLCPLLGFDRTGARIGYGGGHYDRYCATNPDVLRIGVAWSVQEEDAVPTEPHDMMLDAILTEREWIVTGMRL